MESAETYFCSPLEWFYALRARGFSIEKAKLIIEDLYLNSHGKPLPNDYWTHLEPMLP